MKFYDDMVDQIPRKCILCPWNQRETHCLHRWPHIWNSCTNGASHHQNMRELPLKQKRIRIRNLYCSNITRIYRGTIHTIKIRVRKWYLYRLTKACHNYFMCTCTWTHTQKKITHTCTYETRPINLNYISRRALLRWSNRNWKPRLTYLQNFLTNSWSPLLADIRVRKIPSWSQLKRQVKLSNDCFDFRISDNSWQNGIHLQQRYSRITDKVFHSRVLFCTCLSLLPVYGS